jgi:flagellar assembly factor FliW
MPELITKYFGSVSYREDGVIEFPSGLPGFEKETEFLVMEPASNAPLTFLQSLQHPDLCFLALAIQGLEPDYQPVITREDLATLGLDTGRQPGIGGDICCFAIIVVAENGPVTANLLAPVVINRANRRGVQAVRVDSVYSHRHPVTEAVCS